MSTVPVGPFSCSLFPHVEWARGQAIARFLLPTSWQVRRRPWKGRQGGVVPRPHELRSLLVLEGLYWSVLPYTLRTAYSIDVLQLIGPGPAWQGVPCDLGRVHVWLLDRNVPQDRTFNHLPFLLPRGPLPNEPTFPLFGQEFLRTLGWRVTLDFPGFPAGGPTSFTNPDPVGHLELS